MFRTINNAKSKIQDKRVRKGNPRPVDGLSRVNEDILLLILSQAATADLPRCLRVSHLFYELVGPILYGRSMEYDADPSLSDLSIFYGLEVTAWDRAKSFGRAKPSTTKIALLSHVRHLIYYPPGPQYDRKLQHTLLPDQNILPSLESLTFSPRPSGGEANYRSIDPSCPLLTRVRPKHIRIIRNDYRPLNIPLSETCLTKVERVSIIASDYLGFTDYNSGPDVHVNWPKSMKHLDLHFVIRTWPARPYPPEPSSAFVGSSTGIERAAKAVSALLISAEHTGAVMRVVGIEYTLCEENVVVFETTLRELYLEQLVSRGIERDHGERRVDKLEILDSHRGVMRIEGC